MADVNWGALTPLNQMAPIRAETPQAQGAPSPSIPSAPNPNSGLDAMNQASQQATERTRTGILQQAAQDEHAKLPGVLVTQADAHQAAQDTHLTAQETQAKAQYEMAIRQKTSQAFMTGSAKGGTDGGLDAMGQTMLDNGDVEGYSKLEESRATVNKTKAEGGDKALASTGAALANLQSQVIPPTPASKDPKTGQIIPPNPGVSSLDLYKKQYPGLKQINPYLPDPANFKTDGQFHDAVMVPFISTAGPIAKQQAADIEARKNDDLYKAQSVADVMKAKLQAAAKADPNSQETKDAAQAYSNALRNASRVATGGGQGSIGTFQNWKNGPADNKTLIKQNSPQDPNMASAGPSGVSGTSGPSAPTGKVLTVGPDGKLQ